MRRWRWVAAVALLAAAACGSGGAPRAVAVAACQPVTAWAGSESSNQHNDGALVTIPVRQQIRVMHVTVSASYAALPAADGFAELLLIAGWTPTAPDMTDPLLPQLPPDPNFGPVQVATTRGARHNENAALSDQVFAARIVKSNHGAAQTLVDTATDVTVPAGGAVWVRYDSDSTVPLDAEAQIAITYAPDGC